MQDYCGFSTTGLLRKLKESGFTTQGFSGDLVILVRGRHDKIVSFFMQTEVNMIQSSYTRQGLGSTLAKRC